MKKTTLHSAFFNPRALIGFALCLLGVLFGFVALSGLSGTSVQAQVSQKPNGGKVDATPAAAAPQNMKGVAPVLTRPLRETRPIRPSRAPGHDHVEPIRPTPLANDPTVEASLPRQTAMGPVTSAPAPTGISWDGIGVGLGSFVPSSNPPDVNGRVGATQFVQWNNTSFAVFNKTTGALQYGPAAGNTLFQSLGGLCASHNDGDPVVSYDLLAGRWVLSQFVVGGPAGSASHQCIAVSQTSDATGAYYLYDFVTDTTNFVDYPHTGVWPDGYYMSAHIFNAAGTAYVEGRIYVFEREKMILGQTARMQSAALPKDGGTQQYGFLPGDLDSVTPPPAGAPAYVLGPNGQFTNRTDISRVTTVWGATPSITLTSTVNTTVGIGTAPCVYGGRACVPQPPPAANGDALDNLSARFMYRLAYRNNGGTESLVVSGTTTGTTSTPAHGSVKWMEWRGAAGTAAPTIFQHSSFDPDTAYRWMPSMAMDKDGNIALGYSKSSPSIKPGIYMTGRLVTDAINTMGAEAEVQAGLGVQTTGAGNRWGDYTAMTVDPIDGCTFYYTNEYLKTNGAFNWSTRVAAYKFPTCTSAAGTSYGTVAGTITSCATGTPISGVTVTLSNGYAGATDASGNYSFMVPVGTYTATAAGADRNCATATPSSASVTVTGGGTSTQNFCMDGTSKLESTGVTIDDTTSGGNGNGIVNRDECVNLNVGLKNNGCAAESAISATLTTSTAGVTVTQDSATYPDMDIDGSGSNAPPFKISVANSFVCGTDIALSLNLTYASGTKSIALSVPTCAGGANQTIPASTITTAAPSQTDRLGRDGTASTCGGKGCPGGIGTAGTRNYKTFTFSNTSGAPRCYTVALTAALGGGGDIQSAGYQGSYSPTALCTNYLGDSGITGLGTTVGSATYSFTVAALSNFIVVVNTSTGSTNSSVFSGTVSGFVDNTAGPGACATLTPPVQLDTTVSRMIHGGAGTYNVDLTAGNGVECRNGGAGGDYQIVMTFSNNLTNVGSASVACGSVSSSSIGPNTNQYTVNITGQNSCNQLYNTITLTNVDDSAANHSDTVMSPQWGLLIGDTNGDKSVNSGDIGQTKSQSGNPVTISNFRQDVTVDGTLNSADIGLVKSRSGTALALTRRTIQE